MKDKITPLPWKAADSACPATGDNIPCWRVFSLSDAGIAPVNAYGDTPEQMEANAKFVARAVNSHEALLGACKTIACWLISPATDVETITHMSNVVREAIKRAEDQ